MSENRGARWRRLDNAAKIFPSTSGRRDTRVFRFYCECKENVDPEILQQAIRDAMCTRKAVGDQDDFVFRR